MEQQQQQKHLSPSGDVPMYHHQMNFELAQIKFQNQQQNNNIPLTSREQPSYDLDLHFLNKSFESPSSNHRSNTQQQQRYILPSKMSSPLRYLSPEYSAAPQPSQPSSSLTSSTNSSTYFQQNSHQDIVLYPDGPNPQQQNHFLPMFPSTRPTVVSSITRNQFQDNLTPPLTPPDYYRTVKKKSSSTLLVKKSDGVVVSLLNDDDDIMSSNSLKESSTGRKQSITEDTFVQRKKQHNTTNSATGNKRKYICTYPNCGKGFTTSGHLARHNRIHTGEKNFQCLMPGCTSKFSRQDNMMQHYRTHLSVKSRRGSKAVNVNNNNNSLNNHQSTHHRTGPILQESHSKRVKRIINDNLPSVNNSNNNNNNNNNSTNISCNTNIALMLPPTPLTTPTSTSINGYNFISDVNDTSLPPVRSIIPEPEQVVLPPIRTLAPPIQPITMTLTQPLPSTLQQRIELGNSPHLMRSGQQQRNEFQSTNHYVSIVG